MNTLMLPGSNPATVDWLKELIQKLPVSQKSAHMHSYDFWSKNLDKPDLFSETSLLPKDNFELVIAKSLGSVVVLQAAFEKNLQFERAILIGVPMKSLSKGRLDPATLDILKSKRVFVVQQMEDPFGSIEDFKNNTPVNFLTITGNDHIYNDFSLYTEQLADWLGK